MRILFWFLLLAAAAVAVALAAKLVSGYVLFVAPPYRVELSLNLLLVLAVAGFAAGYALVRLAVRASGLPQEVRAIRRRQQETRARSKLDAAVVALLEGRYGKARQFAEEALDIPNAPGIAALVAARAALDTRDYPTAEAHLTGQTAQAGSLAVPRMMLDAEMKLEQGRPLDALAVLQALRKEAGSHTAALRLELRALQGAGRYAEIPPLVDQLVKRKVYGPQEGDHVRAAAHAGELATRANDPAGLRAYWSKLSDAEQRRPRIARAAAKSFLALGGDREAADILVRSLEREWEPDLVSLYAECRSPDPTKQLAEAEALARRTRPGRAAPARIGDAVRARAAVGQGADVFRSEPRARRRVRDSRRAGRALRAARPHRRSQQRARCRAQTRARRAPGSRLTATEPRVRSGPRW